MQSDLIFTEKKITHGAVGGETESKTNCETARWKLRERAENNRQQHFNLRSALCINKLFIKLLVFVLYFT